MWLRHVSKMQKDIHTGPNEPRSPLFACEEQSECTLASSANLSAEPLISAAYPLRISTASSLERVIFGCSYHQMTVCVTTACVYAYLLPATWPPASDVLHEQVARADLGRFPGTLSKQVLLCAGQRVYLVLCEARRRIPHRLPTLGVIVVGHLARMRHANFPRRLELRSISQSLQ